MLWVTTCFADISNVPTTPHDCLLASKELMTARYGTTEIRKGAFMILGNLFFNNHSNLFLVKIEMIMLLVDLYAKLTKDRNFQKSNRILGY